ncbi:MAG: ATP-dependent nuclease [Flavobacterium sp.]
MNYQSEIRDSQINQLFEKVENSNYGKYLKKVRLNPIRGFADDTVIFDFPVTAIIGPNGGGKTTVLGAAGCAYIMVKPSRFFAKSGRLDDSMANWKITYELIDKQINARDAIVRSSKFTNYKWSREHLSRNVAIFGVSRTVPASERPEFSKCASNRFAVPTERIFRLEEAVIEAAQKILGKDLQGYSRITVDNNGKVTLLTGVTENGTQFSEFHFGAGESSIIKMIFEIESLPSNSLILIEEIENGLHPIATIRMVEYLIEVAIRKSIQAIFTTHSNEALLPLPAKAIWSAINNKVFQGKLDVKSLRAITGQVSARLAIFVEDDFAKMWIESIIATDPNLQHDEIQVHKMEGDGVAVKVNKFHNVNPTRTHNSICIVDGDSEQRESDDDKVYRLPGESPESYIYDLVLERVNSTTDSVIGELTVALHKPYEIQEQIKDILNDVRRTNRDYHLLFSQVGRRLGFISEIVVKSAFLNIWLRNFPADVERVLENIRSNYQDV